MKVRTVSPSGELFVASVVICMILSAFGDSVDPSLFGELGFEYALFDLSGEFSVLAMRHWHLLQLFLAGSTLAAGIMVLRIVVGGFFKPLESAPPQDPEKVPIKF